MIALVVAIASAAELPGIVRQKGDGEPLADVVVTASRDGADLATTTSGADGRFVLDVPGDAPFVVTVNSDDHRPLTAEVTPPVDALKLWLERAEPPIEIVIEAFKAMAHPARQSVDAEMAFETPGALDDAIRLVQSLPSVTVQREYSPTTGNLSVRGSSAGDNRVYFDGIELPYLYHYNQYASVFPTSMIDRLDLYPSTFGAAYGDAVGAVIEAVSPTRAPDRLHGSVSLNFVMAGFEVEAPIAKQWTLFASGRRSYQDLVTQSTAQYTLWPNFGDFHVRVAHDGARGRTEIFAFGANDRYDRAAGEIDLLDPVEATETANFQYKRGWETVGVLHRWLEGPVTGRVVAAVVHDHLSGVLSTGGSEKHRTVYLSSRLDLEGQPTAVGPIKLGWGAGWEIRAEHGNFTVAGATPTGLLVAEEAPLLGRGVNGAKVLDRVRVAPYGEARVVAGPTRWFAGLRLPIDSAGKPLLVEPRLTSRIRVADQTELIAAVGLYHQAPESPDLVPGPGDPGLATTAAWQASVGVDQTISSRLEIGLQAYGKLLEDPIVTPIGRVPFAVDRGRVYGGELVTRYRLRSHVFLWGSLGVARSFVELDGAWRPTDGDQPLSGGVVMSWDPSPKWNFGVRYKYGAGLPWTPLVGSVYNAGQDQWDPVPGAYNSARFPAYHKVDVHVGRTWTFKRAIVTLSGELWFVPKASTQLYPTWNYDFTEQGWVTGPSIFPLGTLRVRF